MIALTISGFTCRTRTFYLGKDESEPERSGKSSRYTPKVMFLAAIARPRFNDNSACVFDGKISFWPFSKVVAAKRNSRNRPVGHLNRSLFPSIEMFTVISLRRKLSLR